MCTGTDNETFIVEMQRASQPFFKERSVYYTSRAISRQLPAGAGSWDYQVTGVYMISLLEFVLEEPPSRPGRYIRDIFLTDSATGEIFYDKLQYKYIELPIFVKTETELETDLDKWLFLLKNISRLDKMPAVMNKRIFQKVFSIAEVGKLSKEARMEYEASLKAKWDYENSLRYAETKAEARGEARG